LAETDLSNLKIAKRAGVNERTLRDALKQGDEWNPTVKTVAKLEAAIPSDWQPPRRNGNNGNGRRRT
jgi:hypothetical protein